MSARSERRLHTRPSGVAKGSRISAGERIRILEQQLDQNSTDLNLQFRRIAQIQTELDAIKKMLAQLIGTA